MKKVIFGIVLIVVVGVVILVKYMFGEQGSVDNNQGNNSDNSKSEYTQITMKEAKDIFEAKGDYIILDVRTEEEYGEGHIPGAICVPNETIEDAEIKELPDKEQTIYVYCRSGNRSKQASEKLVKMGYINIIEFGGIIDWEGEIEK